MKRYSQGSEQDTILDYFGDRVARLLDCGAYDGKTFSNSLALFERGWAGTCVEPDPQALDGLTKLHGNNPLIQIVAAAVCDHDGTVAFHNSDGGAVSTTSDAHRRKWATQAAFRTITVPALTVRTLLKCCPGPYRFLNVDVEGESANLFAQFDLTEMGVELVCVEHDGEHKRVLAHCRNHGLTHELYRSGENLIVGK